MHSEREHLDDVAASPARSRRPADETAAGPSLLGSAIGNAAFTQLIRPSVLRKELRTQGAGPLDPDIGDAIAAQAGGGSPLAEPVRADMESHLGYDLSPVRVHTDATAGTLNRAVQAEAFTAGTDVFFQPGAYDPGSSSGRELLAHELTHVVQQSTGAAGPDSRVSSPQDSSEVEARAVGREVVSRQPAEETELEDSDSEG
jgi:hypothetical protein